MKKFSAAAIAALVLIPVSNAGSETKNFGGLKINACNIQTLEGCRTKTIDFPGLIPNEYEVTGFNATIVSVNGESVTVTLYATEKGNVESTLLLKSDSNVLASVNLVGKGI